MSRLRRRFQAMVDRHYKDRWSYVCLLTGNSPESEDILHEAFLLAFDYLREGKTFRKDAGKWLRGTVRHLVYAWWREKRKLPKDLADHLDSLAAEAEDVFSGAIRDELATALEHCLGKLASRDRELVSKRYEQGLRNTIIARRMQKKTATIRVRLFRIRQTLKLCLEHRLGIGA